MVEIPPDDTVQFPLPMLAALDGRPSHVDRRVSVQPLLAEHCKEGRKKGSSETCEEDCLNLDSRAWGTSPLWDRRNVAAEGGVVNLVDEDTEEGRGLVVRIRLESGVDLDDEGGGYCRKQTGL